MTLISDSIVCTRKEHQCHGCARRFGPGTRLRRLCEADGGRAFVSYWCDVCNAMLDDNDEGYALGDIRNEYPEEWEKKRQEIESDEHEKGE